MPVNPITAEKFTTWYDPKGRRFVVIDHRADIPGNPDVNTRVCLLEVETEEYKWKDADWWHEYVTEKQILKPLKPKPKK